MNISPKYFKILMEVYQHSRDILPSNLKKTLLSSLTLGLSISTSEPSLCTIKEEEG